MFYNSSNCLMEGIISHKCLGVRNVNLFSVGTEMLCHFDIFNSAESSNRTRVALTSLDLWEACWTASALADPGHMLISGPISRDGGIIAQRPLPLRCESASALRKCCGVCVGCQGYGRVEDEEPRRLTKKIEDRGRILTQPRGPEGSSSLPFQHLHLRIWGCCRSHFWESKPLLSYFLRGKWLFGPLVVVSEKLRNKELYEKNISRNQEWIKRCKGPFSQLDEGWKW